MRRFLKKIMATALIGTVFAVEIGSIDSLTNANIFMIDAQAASLSIDSGELELDIVEENLIRGEYQEPDEDYDEPDEPYDEPEYPYGEIDVESISFDKTEINGYEGQKYVISPTICPSNASNKLLEWIAKDEELVDVEDGVVTLNGVGKTTVYAKSSNGKIAKCKVNIKRGDIVDIIQFDKKEIKLDLESSKILVPAIIPSSAENKTLKWTSSDSNIVKVEKNGKITGLKPGTAVITATSSNFKKGSIKVKVKKLSVPKSVSLNKTSMTMVLGDKGNSKELLVATVSPSDAKNKTVTWTTSNAAVAKVDKEGNVKAVAAGTAKITATTYNGVKKSCSVTVKDKSTVEKLTLNKTKLILEVGGTASKKEYNLVVTIKPSTAVDKNIEWTSSNSKVASVKNGKVVAKKDGTTIITATSANGKKAECKVTVTDITIPTKISFKSKSGELKQYKTKKLTPIIKPATANGAKLKWSTSDKKIATVTQSGIVTGISKGKAKITVQTENGFTATYTVNVKKRDIPKKVTINEDGNVKIADRSIENKPIFTNVGTRSKDSYNLVIDQFLVETNPRYKKSANKVYENIFAWDVMCAMGLSSQYPHRLNGSKPVLSTQKKDGEINVNETYDWLMNYGSKYGWKLVDAKKAQEKANSGMPVIAIVKGSSKVDGHVMVVRPKTDKFKYTKSKGPVVAVAGKKRYNYANVYDIVTSQISEVKYYVHE